MVDYNFVIVFTGRILCKSYDGEVFGRVKLVKIYLRAPFIDIFYIKVWSRILIFEGSVPNLIIPIYMIRACFSISFYNFTVSKIKFSITPSYIIVCRKVLEKSTSDRKLYSE